MERVGRGSRNVKGWKRKRKKRGLEEEVGMERVGRGRGN